MPALSHHTICLALAMALITPLTSVAGPLYSYKVAVPGIIAATGAGGTLQCKTPWASNLKIDDSVTAYNSATVPAGSSCVSEIRFCTEDGTLSGSYQYQACTVLEPLAASLVGDGVSTAGACAAGATGCATLSSLDKHVNIVLSNNNLTASSPTNSNSVRATLGKTTGKWYWEYSVASSTPNNAMLGVGTPTMSLSAYPGAGNSSTEGWGYWGNNGSIYHNGGTPYSGAKYDNGAVIGIALDADAHTLTFYKDGQLQKTVTGITNTTWYPALSPQTSGVKSTITANFGQSNFVYAPPNGYHAGLY